MSEKILERIADGRTDLVFEYLAQGRSATTTDSRGVSLLKWCAYYGDVSAIRFLIMNGESLNSLEENFGLTGAAFHGHWQLCQFLVESGADVNFRKSDTGETALHAALCKANRPNYDFVVRVLLDNGANPNCTTEPNAETDAFMRNCRTKGETPLHRAAAFGSETVIKMLLDAGAVIDAKDISGDTPITWASWHLRPDSIIRILCYDEFSIHPDRNSTYDHGSGWGMMGTGKPHNQA